MTKIYKKITDLIGNTPLLQLDNFVKRAGVEATILAKLEYFNPAGSVKDRIALAMIENAEKLGLLKPQSVIIEPTSGNTGIGLAMVAAAKGYKIILVMPDTMSVERRKLLTAYGAEIELTDGALGMQGAVDRAEQLGGQTKDSFIPRQFTNDINPFAHRANTGPEIWQDTGGQIDIFISGVGTGGIITGVGEYLKGKDKNIKIIAVEPANSPLLSKGWTGSHKIQGIGANFIPKVLNTAIYDEVISVEDKDAFATCRELAQTEGLLLGISSGATLWTAKTIAKRAENQGKVIVVIAPDSGERYLSTTLFEG